MNNVSPFPAPAQIGSLLSRASPPFFVLTDAALCISVGGQTDVMHAPSG